MKKFLSLTAGLLSVMAVQAADTLFIKAPQVPILIERNDNVLFYMRMDAKETKTLDEVTVTFGKDVPLSQIKSVKLYYGGTDASQDRGKNASPPWNTFPAILRARRWQPIHLTPYANRKYSQRMTALSY